MGGNLTKGVDKLPLEVLAARGFLCKRWFWSSLLSGFSSFWIGFIRCVTQSMDMLSLEQIRGQWYAGFLVRKKVCGGSRLGVFLFCSFIVSALFLTPLNPCFFDYIISFYKHTHWICGLLLSSLFFSCVSLCFVLLAIRHSSLAIVLSLFLCFICVLWFVAGWLLTSLVTFWVDEGLYSYSRILQSSGLCYLCVRSLCLRSPSGFVLVHLSFLWGGFINERNSGKEVDRAELLSRWKLLFLCCLILKFFFVVLA